MGFLEAVPCDSLPHLGITHRVAPDSFRESNICEFGGNARRTQGVNIVKSREEIVEDVGYSIYPWEDGGRCL